MCLLSALVFLLLPGRHRIHYEGLADVQRVDAPLFVVDFEVGILVQKLRPVSVLREVIVAN